MKCCVASCKNKCHFSREATLVDKKPRRDADRLLPLLLPVVLATFMCVFQQSITQRNASVFFAQQKSVACFFTQPQTLQRCLRLLAAFTRRQIETTCIFPATPEANSTNRSCDYIQPMAAALRLRYAALRCVTECWKTRITSAPQRDRCADGSPD